MNDDKKRKIILRENSIFIGQDLQLQKNCMISKNNDDSQLLLLCFVPPSDVLRNRHIDFSRSCSYATKLSSPVLLTFQLPIKNRACYVRETIYSKKPQQLPIRSFGRSAK